MSFIVIEGDNATGKTTLSNLLPFVNINSTEWFIKEETVLKKMPLEKKIPAFLDFNFRCGEFCSRHKKKYVLTRYWISTLCAAYADGLYDFSTTKQMIDQCIIDFPTPEAIVFLRCAENVRMERIMVRRSMDNDFSDPVEHKRNEKYHDMSIFINAMLKRSFSFRTDQYSAEHIAKSIIKLLHNGEDNVNK